MSDAENSFMQALDELQDNLTSEDNSRPLDSDEKFRLIHQIKVKMMEKET